MYNDKEKGTWQFVPLMCIDTIRFLSSCPLPIASTRNEQKLRDKGGPWGILWWDDCELKS